MELTTADNSYFPWLGLCLDASDNTPTLFHGIYCEILSIKILRYLIKNVIYNVSKYQEKLRYFDTVPLNSV